jgi:hypothetical protein
MINTKQLLIDEQTSPLQRIMWVYNVDEPQRRTFENNICAFHIGKGYFLTVAHNLRIQAGFFRSIHEEVFKREIYPKLDGSQNRFLEQAYNTDEYSRKKYLNSADPNVLQTVVNILKQKRFDTRWVSLTEKRYVRHTWFSSSGIMAFITSSNLTRQFDGGLQFYDHEAHKHTFLVEVELVNAFYSADIALYRIVNTSPEIINKIPSVDVDFQFLDERKTDFTAFSLRRTVRRGVCLNEARIEGMLDHFGIFNDEVGGNYVFDGYRYLIKGYFRFGSSGAPYVFYDDTRERFVANAIQSEASGIQLSIKNDREGNFQYVNAIASPLYIIKNELEKFIGSRG